MSVFSTVKQWLQYANLCSVILLVATLPFYYEYRKPMLILFFATYLVELIVSMRWKDLRLNRTRYYFFGLLLFFGLAFCYLPFEANKHLFRILIDRRLALMGFAIVGFFGLNEKVKLNYVLNAIIVTAVAVAAYLVCYRIGFTALLQSANKSELLSQAGVEFVNTHMMFDFFFNLALISVWYILSKGWARLRIAYKIFYFAAAAIVLYILLHTIGRSGFFACLVVLSFVVAIELRKIRRWLSWVAIICALVVVPFGLFAHERMQGDMVIHEPRLFLWKMSLPLIGQKPVLGHGIATGQDKFTALRLETHAQTHEYEGFWDENALVAIHNEFLQTLLTFGGVGLLLLLFIYLSPLWIVEKQKRTLLLIFIIISLIQSMFDDFLVGQQFGVAFGLMMAVILSQPFEKLKQNEVMDK
jgi:O-antigen ligase